MNRLIALIFDDPYKAGEARAALHRMEGEGLLEIAETAVVARYPEGRIRISQDTDVIAKDQRVGHLVGLVAGAVTGTMPLIMVGTLAGRLVGTLRDNGITDKFVKEMKQASQPETSILIIYARSDQERRQKMADRLRAYNPEVLQCEMPPEVEQEIRALLRNPEAAV
jgi:uncharacterized membrane protein